MKMSCRFVLLVCFIALIGAAQAQTNVSTGSDVLRQKINELESIDVTAVSSSVRETHERSLLRLYQNYIAALDRDIEALKKIQAATGVDTDPGLQQKIETLSQERKAATEKLKALGGEQNQSLVVQRPIPRSCEGFFKGNENKVPAGTIWCGKNSTPLVQEIATLSAPILWFSPDEPLRLMGRKIPENLPGHNVEGQLSRTRVVATRGDW